MQKRTTPDWTVIEAEFRAGVLSIRQIAKRHGISDTAIRKYATAHGWGRQEPPAAKRGDVVVLPPVGAAMPVGADGESLDPIEHGTDLARRMLGELDAISSRLGEIEDLIDDETRDDVNTRRRSAMMKAISLPVRALTLKTLVQAMAGLSEAKGGAAKGKKEQRQDAAKAAATGRFAPPAPPKLVVNNP